MLINERILEEFHDSVLVSIQVDWEKETIIADFDISSVSQESKIIQCRKFSMFNCPHKKPWGFSFYVYELQICESTTPDKKKLLITMQSGDIIEIECEAIEII